jgi:putative addiction module component (TIGR02574 family)
MSTKQLTDEALALPLAEKVSLAQALWQSIDSGLADSDEQTALREAIRRDQELSSGAAKGLTHEEAMQAARRAIRCG